MELWSGDLPDFIGQAKDGTLAKEIEKNYRHVYRRAPGASESLSWEESLKAAATVADEAATDDIGVLVEYHLPLSERRIDLMFFGHGAHGEGQSLLVELKRWREVRLEDEFALNVLTGDVEHVHPSQQALDYAGYLADCHSEYVSKGVSVQPSAYCHDMPLHASGPLTDARFAGVLDRSPIFFGGQEAGLSDLLNKTVGAGQGVALMRQVRAGLFTPGKRIVDSLDAVLRHDDEWHLLDEQRKVFNTVWAELQRLRTSTKRSAVLVRGGPGTGKSVIAVQLLAAALRSGLKAVHSTGGKAFTLVMQGTFTGADPVFIWNRSLRRAKPMELDLLLADEAHRIRENSDDRWTRASERNRRSQIDEMLDSAKVSVFFVDEHQYMRPDEIGSRRLVADATDRRDIPLREYDLNTQFRCNGCREYIEWIDYLLGFSNHEPDGWAGTYQVRLASSPEDLEAMKDISLSRRESARLVAGFCWKWSSPNNDRSLVDDVVIGDWRRPWNEKASDKKTYKPHNHPYTLWAKTPAGESQIGCIYSIQGFEFARVGVIWGPDLVWRDGTWVGQKKMSKDGGLRGATSEQVTKLLKHAYRVLLTRGMKGTDIFIADDETREHIARELKRVQERSASFA